MASTDAGRDLWRQRHPRREQPSHAEQDQADDLTTTGTGRGALLYRELRGGTAGRAARQALTRWADDHPDSGDDGPTAA